MNLKEFFVSSGDEFLWVQTAPLQKNFTLLKDGEKFGTMKFRSDMGTLAISEDPIQDWSFKRTGFLNPAITIRIPDADSDIALFLPGIFSGGQLQMLDGRPFGWKPEKQVHGAWFFSDKNKYRIISFSPGKNTKQAKKPGLLNSFAKIESDRMTNQEFSMMVNLGFYLIVLHQMDLSQSSLAAL